MYQMEGESLSLLSVLAVVQCPCCLCWQWFTVCSVCAVCAGSDSLSVYLNAGPSVLNCRHDQLGVVIIIANTFLNEGVKLLFLPSNCNLQRSERLPAEKLYCCCVGVDLWSPWQEWTLCQPPPCPAWPWERSEELCSLTSPTCVCGSGCLRIFLSPALPSSAADWESLARRVPPGRTSLRDSRWEPSGRRTRAGWRWAGRWPRHRWCTSGRSESRYRTSLSGCGWPFWN